MPDKVLHSLPKIVYVGNLGFGRWEPLVDIAKAVQTVNTDWSIDVYGVIQTDAVKELFKKTKGLNYKGTIPYDKVLGVIKQSDLLLLVENQAPHYAKSTEYGFSTKITDYLYSHIPIFAYGSTDNVGISYLKENNAAFVISDKALLPKMLESAVTDTTQRKHIVESALNIAVRNHDAEKNAMMFKNMLEKVTTN